MLYFTSNPAITQNDLTKSTMMITKNENNSYDYSDNDDNDEDDNDKDNDDDDDDHDDDDDDNNIFFMLIMSLNRLLLCHRKKKNTYQGFFLKKSLCRQASACQNHFLVFKAIYISFTLTK